MSRFVESALMLALALVLAACGSDGSAGGDADASDARGARDGVDSCGDLASRPDQGPAPDIAPDATPTGHLEFVDAFGDDQQPCSGVDTCVLLVTSEASRKLAVRWVPDAGEAENVAITFAFVDDPQGQGDLAAGTVYTDATGYAATTLKVASYAACVPVPSRFSIRARVHGAAEPGLTFDVRAEPNVDDLLTVAFAYYGDEVLDGVTVDLYGSDLPAAATLSCAGLDPYALPTASYEIGPVSPSQVAKLPCFAGLEDGTPRFYTIVARGELADGTLVAFGCNDTEGKVDPTAPPANVVVMLEDLAQTGDLRIQFVLGADVAVPLNTYSVSLSLAEAVDCLTDDPLAPIDPADIVAGPYTVPSAENTVQFPGLLANETYAVRVTAEGPDGTPAAAGCLDDITVGPDALTTVEVTLHPIP